MSDLKTILLAEAGTAIEKDFDESQHPRDDHGKFAESGGGDGGDRPANAPPNWTGKTFDHRPDEAKALAKLKTIRLQSYLAGEGRSGRKLENPALKTMENYQQMRAGYDRPESETPVNRHLYYGAYEGDRNVGRIHQDSAGRTVFHRGRLQPASLRLPPGGQS